MVSLQSLVSPGCSFTPRPSWVALGFHYRSWAILATTQVLDAATVVETAVAANHLAVAIKQAAVETLAKNALPESLVLALGHFAAPWLLRIGESPFLVLLLIGRMISANHQA